MPDNRFLHLKRKERDERRRLILESARDLFARKDFLKVNVREIAKAAGVSVGTIYNYYADLNELFLDIFLKSAEEITEILDQENKEEFPSFERLCKIYISYLNQNMTFYQMMGHFMLGGELSPKPTKKLNHIMRLLMDRIEGSVRAMGTQKDTRIVSHALFSALNGIMISYARYPGRNAEEIRRHTLKLAGIIAKVFEEKG
ncbi:MAG: TetR/AcrR family transcriptional regulator [Deltaproteobacteria bacterium]|nr:TetR/AcrR family transcriptional regulator [Deltaproteobacteria bacterium]